MEKSYEKFKNSCGENYSPYNFIDNMFFEHVF